MQVVYLGFFETLGEILSGIFNEVLAPILLVILNSMVPILIDAFRTIFYDIIIELEIAVLRMIDFLVAIFDIFSGVRYIKVQDKNYFLLQYLINSDSLFTQVFWLITILSAGLCVLFTIYTVAKSVSDGAMGQEYNSMGKILGTALRAMLMFLMIPTFMYFAISLTQTLIVYINHMLTQMSGTSQGIGTLLFLSCSLKAHRQEIKTVSFTDSLRIDYLDGTKHYYDLEQVRTDFDPTRCDLMILLILEITVILIMLGSIFVFVRRIFEIIVLYIASPLFICVMPMDQGAMFGKWRDMMFAKLVSSFAPVFGMRIFLMLTPLLMGSGITYSGDVTQDALIKMFLVVGGCYSIYKSQFLLLEIISPEAAQQAKSNVMAIVGMATGGARMVAGLASAAPKAASQQRSANRAKLDKKLASGKSEVSYKKDDNEEKSQAFRG